MSAVAETRKVRRVFPKATSSKSWPLKRVDEIGDVQLGRQRSPKNRSAEYPTKYLRAANITERGLDLSDILEMDFKPDERDRYVLSPGDIILSEASGSASQVGKPALWNAELPLCCFQNTVIRLRPKHADPKYLLWVFTHFYRNGIFARVAAGVGINHLSAAKFKRLEIPVPPFFEQRRIVAEIEKQFTRLDAGVTALRRTQANLKRYRAAVLKAACEGRLVPSEPAKHQSSKRSSISRKGAIPDFESGSMLRERVLNERRLGWQGPGKYKEPAAPYTIDLPALPYAWTWATADQCTSMITDGEHITPQRTESGILLLSARNVLDGRISLEDVDYVPQHEYDRIAKRLVIRPGDVLLSGQAAVDACYLIAKDVDDQCEWVSNQQKHHQGGWQFAPGGPSVKVAVEYGRLDVSTISCRLLGEHRLFVGDAINYAARISRAGIGNRCVVGPQAAAMEFASYP